MESSKFAQIIGNLQKAGVRFLIVGGIAVVAHGYERFTEDIDFVLDMERANVESALAVFQAMNYRPRVPVALSDFAVPENRAKWRTEKHMLAFTLLPRDQMDPSVDLFTESPFAFEEEYAKALTFELYEGVSCRVICLRTLLEMKRGAGRGKDLVDIEHLEWIEKGKVGV